MFGNDDGHHDRGGFSLGQLLFALFLWRELESGRLSAGDIFRALFVIAAVVGGGLLLLLAVVGLSAPSYEGPLDYGSPYVFETEAPAYVPAWTPEPVWTPEPTATASPTPKPTTVPGIGKRVAAGGGWTVTVNKVQRWTPSWYHQPGWRLLTVYVTVGMPAADLQCLLPDGFWLTARGGTEYWWSENYTRDPALIACSDYHRPTTDHGWLTFEVRDKDAKGLLLGTCGQDWLSCDAPTEIRIS